MNHELIIGHGTTIVDPAAGLFTPNAGSAVLSVEPSMLRNGGSSYHEELQYLALLQELVDKSDDAPREDRTGTGTFSVFGRQMRFDLTKSFPLLTTKNVWWKGVVAELLWMISGYTNIKPLIDQGVHIWDEWADKNGNLGPVYGAQWRSWVSNDETGTPKIFDQIGILLDRLKTKPNDRGHVITAWNPGALDQMALRPCHCLFQFYVDEDKLSCQLYQRSADIFLGVPFNIASYALLTGLIAQEVGLQPGEFIHTFGDLHLYANHVEQAKLQLTRTPRDFPDVGRLNNGKSLFELTPEDIVLTGYDPHPPIKAKVSV